MPEVIQQVGSRAGNFASRPLPLMSSFSCSSCWRPTALYLSSVLLPLPASLLSLLRSSFSVHISVFQALFSLSLSFCQVPAENLMTANPAQPESGKFLLVSDCNFSCFKIHLYPLLSSLADEENFGSPSASLNNHHHHHHK